MIKFLNLFFAFLLTFTAANAESIAKVISNSNINKSAVAVSVKDAETGKVIYEHNSKKPINPASTLKAVTLAASLDELGKDYEFTTVLYKTTNNDLIMKLGADPFLKFDDLKQIFKTAKEKNIFEPKTIFIDDTIVDKVEWGEGWQWDDDLNPLMPKFGAYNLDNNLLTVTIDPTVKGGAPEIKLPVFYPLTCMNLITTDNTTNIKISRSDDIAPDVLTFEGTVFKQYQMQIPIKYPKRYFTLRLNEAVNSAKIGYYGGYPVVRLPGKNIYVVDKITHPISNAVEKIMKNSNNMTAETVFKLAGGHYANTTGTAQSAVEMLLEYCKQLGVNTEDIKVVDGSGVSKNNLVTADFMTSFLVKQYQKSPEYKDIFASAGEGTLKNRMLYFGDKIKAKTGTLTDVSAIAGYITTVKGRTYAFDIMINDAKSRPSEKKMLEEYILRTIQSAL